MEDAESTVGITRPDLSHYPGPLERVHHHGISVDVGKDRAVSLYTVHKTETTASDHTASLTSCATQKSEAQ